MQFLWRQKLGKPECPYLVRWVISFPSLFSIRLHRWYFGDDDRAMHDHGWNFGGLVLWGKYTDVSPEGREEMPRWKFFYRRAEHRHTVETEGCLTLLVTGPEKRVWGFWVWNKSKTNQVWQRARRYFFKYGHHQCQ